MLPLQRCAHSTVGRGPRARCSRLQKQRLRRAEAGRPGSSLPPGSTRAAGPAVHSQLPHTASTTARERGAEPAQRVPTPGPSPGPLGLSCGAGGRLESCSTQQAQGNRLQGGLEVAKALFLCPSGAPQMHDGGKDTAGSSVMLPLRAELPGWEPKGPAQLVPVPPAQGSTGRSLAEPARSCLLQQPPTRSTAELCVPTAQQGRQRGERGDRWPFPRVGWYHWAPGAEQGLCQQRTQQGASEHGLGSP